jgi:DNA polymerase-3 subunit beta
LPAKALIALRLLSKKDSIRICNEDNSISFTDSTTTITAQKIDAKYPAYKSVIPHNNDINATIDKDVLVSAIDRLSKFANDQTRMITLSFGQEAVTITATDYDKGLEATETHQCECTEAITISFNAGFLSKMVKNISTKDVVFELSKPNTAALIKEIANDDYLSLIMPVMPA